MTECRPDETFDLGLFTCIGDGLPLRKLDFRRPVLPNYQRISFGCPDLFNWVPLTVGHGKDRMRS